MGLQLNVDLECIAGPTKEAYVRIDTYRVDKVSSKLKFSVTYWLSAKHAQDFNRTYLEDSLNQARGILSNKAVYYPTPDSDGIEVELPTFFQLDMANEQSVDVPIMEEQTTVEDVPYISFDSEGNEITKTRKVKITKEVQVDTVAKIKKVVDNSILGNLPKYCYTYLRDELGKIVPIDNIINN